MTAYIDLRLNRLMAAGQAHLLRHGLKGLEKESLRIGLGGEIAQTPHPRALGSALTHPFITTDYSEALIELITPPFSEPGHALGFLNDLHSFVYQRLRDEVLLGTSMPCGLAGDESIPIARYGSSNIGTMKNVYRRGLGYRYGRSMQAIAGVHFNYSVNEGLWPVLKDLIGSPLSLRDFISESYFGIVRNIHRYGWLVFYLFGASPAVCRSFFTGRENLSAAFGQFDADTLYRPGATSLRMSDIGYRNDNQAELDIRFDNVDDYVASLTDAINRPYPAFERIGVKVDGEYRQLNANVLQIENEYYSSIRPKQITRSGEKPTLALKRRGVQYVELRSLDVDYRSPAGVGLEQMHVLETLLLFCLLADSPPLTSPERTESSRNGLTVACCGRTPGFSLMRDGRAVSLQSWAGELLEQMRPIASILDGDDRQRPYSESLERQFGAVADPDRTPSARMLAEMRASGECFGNYCLRLSKAHGHHLVRRDISEQRRTEFEAAVETSLAEQARIEAEDRISFDEFLASYFAQSA